MKTNDFSYSLPKELIAQSPIEQRDASRMMLLDKLTGETADKHFYNLPDYLKCGDCLVLNDSRVLPARLIGERTDANGELKPVEILLLNDKGEDRWECLAKPGRKLTIGTKLSFGKGLLTAEVVERLSDGNKLIKFYYEGIFLEILDMLGEMPLPPYIKQRLEDKDRYQTVYSKNNGSAAAPTAGLHFTREMIQKLEADGIEIAYITLHIGLGTFRPVSEDDIENHLMHLEYYIISPEAAEKINNAKKRGNKVIAIGTTSCRTLEAASEDGYIKPCSGWTDIFIYPGYKFKMIDGLLTNFHLPESTLIMLVSALAGRENVLRAYESAVEKRYRFFSFGDCMFINNFGEGVFDVQH